MLNGLAVYIYIDMNEYLLYPTWVKSSPKMLYHLPAAVVLMRLQC